MSSRLWRSALTPSSSSAIPAPTISDAPMMNASAILPSFPVLTSEENTNGPVMPPAAVPIA